MTTMTEKDARYAAARAAAARDYSWVDYPAGDTLMTKFGAVRVRALGHSIMVDHGDAFPRMAPLRGPRGVECSISAHLTPSGEYHGVTQWVTDRLHAPRSSSRDVTPAAESAIRAELEGARL